MPTAVSSSFDVAYWFKNRAEREGIILSVMKLQRLLFLAQAYFAGSTRGERLMPSMFLVTEQGPVEPNLLRVMDAGLQNIESVEPRRAVVDFLDGIWETFGRQSQERLDEMVFSSPPVQQAMQEGRNTEVSTVAMYNHFSADRRSGNILNKMPRQEPKVQAPKFHRGKPVKKWVPGMKG